MTRSAPVLGAASSPITEVPHGLVELLLQFLPVLPAEEASESSGERRTLVVSSIGMEDEGAFRRREIRGFFVGQCATNQGRGDLRYLITIDKSQPVLRLDGDTVEEIELRDLQDVLDRPELAPALTQYRGANG